MDGWFQGRKRKKAHLNYFSDEFGLHLVLGRVEEESYAYQCGVREGDIIVYVNGWLITVMDKPQVYSMQCILFFVQTNGLSLPGCCEPIPSWSEHCDPGNLEGIRPAARHHCICSGPDPLRVRPLFLMPSYLPHFWWGSIWSNFLRDININLHL